MSNHHDRLSAVAMWLCVLASALGVVGLLGNALDVDQMLAWIPGRPRMQLSTSLAVLLGASAAALQHARRAVRTSLGISRALGGVIVVFASLVLLEYASGANLFVDWHFPSEHPTGPHPGRASPLTALTLVALGGALLLGGARSRFTCAAREALSLATILAAFTALIGHAYGAGPLYEFEGSHVTGVALSTGVALGALGIAAWLARPSFGLLRIVTAPGPGGRLMRQLGFAAVAGVPLLIPVYLMAVNASGLSDLPLVLAIASVLAVVAAVAPLAAAAGPIERGAAALERSRRRTQELFEQAPLGVFVADLSGRYTEVNTAGCKLLDFSREEILNKTIVDLLPEHEVERLWRSRERMLAGAMQTDDWTLRRKDGTYVPVEVTAKVLADGRWQAFVRDVSERRELEQRLLESRDFLERVLESSTEYAIIAEDLAGRVVLWNEGARRAFGHTADEIHGKSSDVLVASGARSEWTELHARGLKHGKAVANLLARRKDGTTFLANVACTRQRGRDDAAAGVLLVMRDLTVEQRHLAEQEFLARVGVELAACLDLRETLDRVTHLGTSFLGDLVAIDMVQPVGLTRVRALEHGRAQELARDVARLGSLHAAGHPLATVIETKEPLLLAHISAADRTRFATSPEHARVLERVNATSAMLVPLIARGQLLAVLSIAARNGSRTYGAADLRLALELGRRAALALDNVQLLQQSRLQGAVTTNLAEAVLLVRVEDSSIVYANPRAETMFGFTARELGGRPIESLHAQREALSASDPPVEEELDRSGAWHGELECVHRDGRRFWCSLSLSNFDHEQHGGMRIALYTDIDERKRLEQQSARALSEKEVLLKEVHHRVKNNLQVISSLFSLQRERTQNPELRSLLDESRIRVASIALVHEQLYRATDLAAVDFDDYLRSLLAAIRASYGAERIELQVSARDVLLDLDQAVPCALIVCELVSNSLRHAFGEASGKVWVRLEREADGFFLLEVGDDGRGLPAALDWTKARSLGLKLVQSLARQLRGSITAEREHGTRFRLRFPSSYARNAAGAASVGGVRSARERGPTANA